MKAIFLDRDGVINIDNGYVYKIEDFKFVDDIFDTLREFIRLGFSLFIITNQSGIARGYYSKNDFNILMEFVTDEFKKNCIDILQIEFCPHLPSDDCRCRKPKTGMIQNILENYTINIDESLLIGDSNSDIECANNINMKSILIDNKNIKIESSPTFVVPSIKYSIPIIKERKWI
jgi:D-glycero-D-manno-heptose 1,7-bisphosphate phosphatase